jgi:transposase
MLYLGIDQHSKQITVNLRNEQGDVVLRRQVSTQWKRVEAFFDQLRGEAAAEGGFVAVLEVCGFNDWLLKMLDKYGCKQTVLVQPEGRSKKKTDRRDASTLAEILWVNRQRLLAGQRVQGIRQVQFPSPQDAEDRQLTATRKRAAQVRTRTLNKVQHILLRHNLRQECPTKAIQTKAARKWLSELSLSEIDRLEMNQFLEQWDLCNQHLAELEKKIKDRQRQNNTAVLIATAPGASAFSSLALASRIGDIKRFLRPASLANYWGLTPGCRNSGETTDRLGSITKQGSAMARFILGQMVLHVLRKDPAMRAWYSRIKKRRGSKIARVAVMRRLATIIWHMIHHQRPYAIGGRAGVEHIKACMQAVEGQT